MYFSVCMAQAGYFIAFANKQTVASRPSIEAAFAMI